MALNSAMNTERMGQLVQSKWPSNNQYLVWRIPKNSVDVEKPKREHKELGRLYDSQ